MSKKWTLIGTGVVLLALFIGLSMRPKPLTPRELSTRAGFTYPTTLALGIEDFRIVLNGVDAKNGVPEIPSGARFKARVTTMPIDRTFEGFEILPRLLEQEHDGYKSFDIRCDLLEGLSNGKNEKDGMITYEFSEKFKLRPGDYVVRYYRSLKSFDEDVLLKRELIAIGKLKIIPGPLPPEDAVVPLADKRNLLPMLESE